MLIKLACSMAFAFSMPLMPGFAPSCLAQENSQPTKPKPKPVELEVLKAAVGIWDAEIEVWPEGPNAPAVKFKGVEENRPYGEHWLASDFDSDFRGQTVKIHSIIGYDLDQKTLVGTVIDHGAYAASMTGNYDQESKTVAWQTQAKDANGNPMLQKTLVTQVSANERLLVLSVPGKKKGEFAKFMQIRFVKRD